MIRTRTPATITLIAVLGGGAIAGQVIAQTSQPAAVKREALAATSEVKAAKGRSLGLSRVIVPAGAELALHRHQGTQVAYVQSGVLTYHVESGSVRVLDGSPDEDPTVVRKIDSGETGKIRAGEWIVEQPTDVHSAANKGKKRVKIYLSTLLRTGAPPSTPVD